MKYNINFNQKAVIDNKWDCLTANHMVLLDCLVGSFNTRKLKTLNEHGDIWYWLSVSEILKQAPILRIKERQCRNIIKDLSDCGLVELHPENKKLGKHYIRLGVNYSKLLYSEPMQNIANLNKPMQNNADDLCNNLQSTYAENCNPPMQNIADYNSINYNDTNIINNKENKDKIKEYTREPEIFDQISSEKFIDALTAEDKRKKVAPKKEKFGEHENVFLTIEEAEKLYQKFGDTDYAWIINKLSNFKIQNDKKYKSDYGAINNWVIEALLQHKIKNNGSSKHSTVSTRNAFGSIRDKIKREIQGG